MARVNEYENRYCRLLKMGPFERRGGGWRFGTNRISENVVERLIESGRVVRIGNRIMLRPRGVSP